MDTHDSALCIHFMHSVHMTHKTGMSELKLCM